MENIELRMEEEDVWPLLISAFRYALGRRTYMPALISGIILANRDKLTIYQRQQLAREVYEEKDMFPGALGDKCDEVTWLNFAAKITSEE